MRAPRRSKWMAFVAALCLAVTACTRGGSASGVGRAVATGRTAEVLARYERENPRDPSLLRAIAGATLERAARADDSRTREMSFGALATIGTHARTVLARLTETDAPAVRARALLGLSRLGDRAARHALVADLENSDADARAAAVEVLDPVDNLDRLAALTESLAGVVRLAAVGALAQAERTNATRLLLEQLARRDPLVAVRVAALSSLARQGPAAADAIVPVLSDPDARVRMAAIGALVRSDAAHALRMLDRFLATDPNPEGIEAARALLGERVTDARDTARGHLTRALAASNPILRAQAAVALSALKVEDRRVLAAERLATETVRVVRFSLALALGADDARAWAVFATLMPGADVIAAEAAGELARRGDRHALTRLLDLRASASAAVRRSVVRALGRDLHRPDDVHTALIDRDITVRIAAAAAILAAG